jgi:hypothetical protein
MEPIYRINDRGDYVLPRVIAGTSPEMAALLERYKEAFFAVDDACADRQDATAMQVKDFAPSNLADIAAKILIGLHYANPLCDGVQLATFTEDAPCTRLALEIILTGLGELAALGTFVTEAL